MKKNNSGIIPVTHSIREYLKYQEDIKQKIKMYYKLMNLSETDFQVFEKNHTIVIEHYNDDCDRLRQIEYLNRVKFLMGIANKLHKSLIWVYQELVLSGYGYDINEDSDIYQVSLLAYQDISSFLIQGDEKERMFEDSHLLDGKQYECCYFKKKLNRNK